MYNAAISPRRATPVVPFVLSSDSDILDAARLRAIANLAKSRGNVRFTPGGGVLFDTPATPAERRALPAAVNHAPRFIDLPRDRFQVTLAARPDFRAFVDAMTIAHSRAGYRLVVIPLDRPLSGADLLVIADLAEAFGHNTVRLTADVSIRLPNVPEALLRPLFDGLRRAGLTGAKHAVKDAA